MDKKIKLTLAFFMITGISFVLTSVTDARQSHLWVGDKVRIDSPNVSEKLIIGTVTHLTESDIIIISRGLHYYFPYSSVQKVEVSRGWHSNEMKGLLIGATAGVLLFSIIVAIGHQVCIQSIYTDCISRPASWLSGFFEGAVAGFAIGGFIGVVFGATVITDNWVNVPIQSSNKFQAPQGFYSFAHPGISIKLKF